MPIKIRYVSLPAEVKDPFQETRKNRRTEIIHELIQVMENHPHGIEFLRLRSMKGSGFAYYFEAAECILADFTNKRQLEKCPRDVTRVAFQDIDSERKMWFCHLGHCGLLHEKEYASLLRIASGRELRTLKDLPVVTLEPSDAKEPCRDHGEGLEAYGIPIFRCAWDPDWKRPQSCQELLYYLISKSFLPELEDMEPFGKIWDCIQNTGTASPVLKADRNGDTEEQGRWQNIVKFYCETGLRTANLAPYPDDILLKGGSWELYRFAGLEGPDSPQEHWYEVSGLYARNPLEDVAPDAEYVAIDFGTANTVAAVYQDNGAITTMPVSGGIGRGQVENPTVLQFKNLEAFLAAYTSEDYRPKTSFDQVTTSHNARAAFESPLRKDARNYLNQLKQWANDPNQTIHLIDGQSQQDITLGRKMDAETLTVDPIELYAYYIGLSINDLRWGKIYLKYLLSYSATYSSYSRERIRESFQRGLQKALPPEVGKSREIKVQLWQDEAASYAICALNRFLLTKEDVYAEELKTGIFYGIYDFGGGTLDFSFGTMCLKQENQGAEFQREVQHFTQLRCGGSPVMGCENLLDELAYIIFDENYQKYKNPNIKCVPPMGSDPRQYQNRHVVGFSEFAQFNTCALVAYLRKKWIGQNGPGVGRAGKASLKLLGEDGISYEWIGDSNKSGGNIIQMDISDKEIEAFFERKVNEGIELFLNCLEKTIKTNPELKGQACHVFLAGSASQAARVKRLFQEKETSGAYPAFVLHLPLPTEEDRTARKADPSIDIPTAKSGVTYGLLMSRPGAEDVIVDRKMPEVAFHYHIGAKIKPAMNNGKGMFQLLLEKTAIPPHDAGVFRWCRMISRPIFELLYTFDDCCAMTGESWAINNTVRVLSLCVPPECVGKGLYIRAAQGSDIKAELGVLLDAESADLEDVPAAKIWKIGDCDFAHGAFTANEQPLPVSRISQPEPQPQSEPLLQPEPLPRPESMSRQKPQPKSPGFGKEQKEGRAQAKKENCQLGYLLENNEPQWVLDTEKPQGKKELGHGFKEESFVLCWKPAGESKRKELIIPLRGDGVKRVFVLEASPSILRLGCRSRAGMYQLTVDLRSQEIQEDIK